MLTSSSNQYLRPEYLTPLPTTLDAKKSPLALLAQTCSQIGADPPNAKPLWPSLSSSSSSSGRDSGTGSGTSSTSSTSSERSVSSNLGVSGSVKKSKPSSGSSSKNDKALNPKSKISGGERGSSSPNNLLGNISSTERAPSNEKNITIPAPTPSSELLMSTSASSSLSIDEQIRPSSRASGGRSKTPGSTKGTFTPPVGNVLSPGSSSSSSSGGNKSPEIIPAPISSSGNTNNTITPSTDITPSKSHESSSSSISSNLASSASALGAITASTSIPTSSSNSSLKLNLTGPDLSPLGSLASKHSSALGAYPSLYPGLPPPPPPQTLASGTGIPPYLHSYARLKAAAAASHSDPMGANSGVCSGGPLCTGCQLGNSATGHLNSLAAAAAAASGASKSCPAGCVQCDHHKGYTGVSNSAGGSSFPGFFPGFPPLPPSLASLYSAHALAAASAAAHLNHHSISSTPTSTSSSYTNAGPYICNWIYGDNYCGKRFKDSEELLVHLKTHASMSSTASSSTPTSSLDPLSAVLDHRYGPIHPLLSAAFNRSYPTPPLSPLSSLNPLSSARFHPYSKHPGTGASLLGPPAAYLGLGAAHPLNPYPYGFYGRQGLGHP